VIRSEQLFCLQDKQIKIRDPIDEELQAWVY